MYYEPTASASGKIRVPTAFRRAMGGALPLGSILRNIHARASVGGTCRTGSAPVGTVSRRPPPPPMAAVFFGVVNPRCLAITSILKPVSSQHGLHRQLALRLAAAFADFAF